MSDEGWMPRIATSKNTDNRTDKHTFTDAVSRSNKFQYPQSNQMQESK